MLIRRWSKSRDAHVWYVRLINEKGKKQLFPTGHTSKKIAQQYENKLKNEIAEKKMFPERFFEKRLFKDFVPEYLAKHAANTRSYDFYEVMCRKLLNYFGDKYLHEISRYHVESYQSERSQRVSVYTVNREVTILKGICTKAIDWGFLDKNPVKGVKLGREEPRQRSLSPDEIAKLVESCGKERMAPYLRSVVIIALHTAARKKELLNLKRQHIYMDRDMIWIDKGKGGFSRSVHLDSTAKREIAKLLLKGKSEYLIHGRDGKPIQDIKKSFNSAVRRAQLQNVHFHDLRKTCGTVGALDAGIDEKTLQKIMGHASIETTMKHYVMSTEEHQKEAIQRLGGILDTYMDTSKKEAIKEMA